MKRHEAEGHFFHHLPDHPHLERLCAFANVDDVLQACAVNDEPLWTSCPRAGWLAGNEARYMEHEAGRLASWLWCALTDKFTTIWTGATDQAVPLLKNVLRLTAPNPGVMTGPGTNSYLVGDPNTGYIAIDPGPADPRAPATPVACRGRANQSHCVHPLTPGPFTRRGPLASAVYPQAPHLGLASRPTARANSRFTPERELADGEKLVLQGQGLDGEITHTLRVVHTPGHAANHLCAWCLKKMACCFRATMCSTAAPP